MTTNFGTDGVNQQFATVYTTHTTLFVVDGQCYAWIIDPAGGFDIVFMAIDTLDVNAWKTRGAVGSRANSGITTATPFALSTALIDITAHYVRTHDVAEFMFSGWDTRLAKFYDVAAPRVVRFIPAYEHTKTSIGHVFKKRAKL